jgi:hypothetical protein
MAKAGFLARQDAEHRKILDRKATRRARRRDAPSHKIAGSDFGPQSDPQGGGQDARHQIFSPRPIFLHRFSELLSFRQISRIDDIPAAGILPNSANWQIAGIKKTLIVTSRGYQHAQRVSTAWVRRHTF